MFYIDLSNWMSKTISVLVNTYTPSDSEGILVLIFCNKTTRHDKDKWKWFCHKLQGDSRLSPCNS